MNNEPAPENEAELEAFRRRWREEVQSRNKNPQTPQSPERVKPHPRRKSTVQSSKPAVHASSSSAKKADDVDYDHFVPQPYHDLPNKEEAFRLGAEGQGQEQERAKALHEPSSALEHYEKAVEKETHGQLGDSLNHYRKAFKVGLIPLLLSFTVETHAEVSRSSMMAFTKTTKRSISLPQPSQSPKHRSAPPAHQKPWAMLKTIRQAT
jgi:hypothetical protein